MLNQHHLQNGNTVFITTVTRKRQPFFKDPSMAREAIDILFRVQGLYPFFLYGFVIMPDHCHLLLKVPEQSSLSKIVGRFKCGVSHGLCKGPLWQPRFDAKTPFDPKKVLQYIHENPVKAGLVEAPEQYPWSSASGRWDVSEIEDWF